MHYVCIKEDKVVSLANYNPTVPKDVQVIIISDEDANKLYNQTHYFDVKTKTLIERVKKDTSVKDNAIKFLNDTDWMVLRHLREKALKIPTTLSKDEYLVLEQQREDAARILSS